MLVSEFIDRTGYRPTAEEYADIEQAYYVFDGNKEEYCRAWCKANPHKAGTLTAAIKEQQRLSNVFDNVVAWIRKNTKWTKAHGVVTFWRSFCSSDWNEHIEEVQKATKCADRKELRDMLWRLSRAHAVTSGWASERWEYLYGLKCWA